jgi:hypothetical protein
MDCFETCTYQKCGRFFSCKEHWSDDEGNYGEGEIG